MSMLTVIGAPMSMPPLRPPFPPLGGPSCRHPVSEELLLGGDQLAEVGLNLTPEPPRQRERDANVCGDEIARPGGLGREEVRAMELDGCATRVDRPHTLDPVCWRRGP